MRVRAAAKPQIGFDSVRRYQAPGATRTTLVAFADSLMIARVKLSLALKKVQGAKAGEV